MSSDLCGAPTLGDLVHGGFARRVWTLARVRSCHPNELRSPEFVHPVERFDRGRNCGGATGVMAGFQGVADDTLVTPYGGLDL
jgi:hypothetical protein